MPYTSKVSSPGISVDTNNDGVIDGRIHRIKNIGNFDTFSITNGELTLQGPAGGTSVGGSDTQVQFNDGGTTLGGHTGMVYSKTSDSSAGRLTVANLTVSGELIVSTTTTLDSNTVNIGDSKIVLNSDFSGAGPTESAGFEVERGDEDNVNFIWNETTDKFAFQVGSAAAAIGEVGSIFATQTHTTNTNALTYTFASDTDTGIQHTALNQLGLVVADTRVLMVNANGVHINPSGASGATNALDVVGDATITGDTTLTGDVDIVGSLDVDNLNFNHNTISNTGANQHIIISPNANADVFLTSDVVLGTAVIGSTQIGATGRSGALAGVDLRIYAGSAGIGADPNLSGGDLELRGGGGKGTGKGGDILLQVTPSGSSGANFNSYATAVTISGDDKSAVFEGAVTINGDLTISGSTTTVSSTTVSHADPVLQLNQGETNNAGAGVTGSVSGFQVDRGQNSGTDIAITRFVWDDSVDAFRCQIANNAPTNSTFVDTQLRVGTPSDNNDAATKGYVDTQLAAVTFTTIRDADDNTKIQVEQSTDENKIRFDTAGTERMIIDDAGLVGIGTSAPTTELHIVAAADPTITLQQGTETGTLKVKGLQDSHAQIIAENQTASEECLLDLDAKAVTGQNQEVRVFRNANEFSDGYFLIKQVGTNTNAFMFYSDKDGTDHEAQFDGPLKIGERASAKSDTTGYGQLWVKNESPTELYFTTDAGDDIQITDGTTLAGGGSGGGGNAFETITFLNSTANRFPLAPLVAQLDVVADSTTDTLTVRGGNGIRVLSDAGGDLVELHALDGHLTTTDDRGIHFSGMAKVSQAFCTSFSSPLITPILPGATPTLGTNEVNSGTIVFLSSFPQGTGGTVEIDATGQYGQNYLPNTVVGATEEAFHLIFVNTDGGAYTISSSDVANLTINGGTSFTNSTQFKASSLVIIEGIQSTGFMWG